MQKRILSPKAYYKGFIIICCFVLISLYSIVITIKYFKKSDNDYPREAEQINTNVQPIPLQKKETEDVDYYEQGMTFYKSGKYDQAVNSFNKAIEKNPLNKRIQFLKAQCLEKLGNPNDSLKSYKEFINNTPESEMALKKVAVAKIAKIEKMILNEKNDSEENSRKLHITNKNPKLPTIDNNSSSSSGFEKRISRNNHFGCTDRVYLDKLIGYIVDGDNQAFYKALDYGIHLGYCTMFSKGEVVYIEDTSIFSGLIKVRRKGETTEYWTDKKAFE